MVTMRVEHIGLGWDFNKIGGIFLQSIQSHGWTPRETGAGFNQPDSSSQNEWKQGINTIGNEGYRRIRCLLKQLLLSTHWIWNAWWTCNRNPALKPSIHRSVKHEEQQGSNENHATRMEWKESIWNFQDIHAWCQLVACIHRSDHSCTTSNSSSLRI